MRPHDVTFVSTYGLSGLCTVRDGSKHFVKRLGRLWLAWQVDDGRTLPLIPAVCLDSTAVGTNFNEMASSALPCPASSSRTQLLWLWCHISWRWPVPPVVTIRQQPSSTLHTPVTAQQNLNTRRRRQIPAGARQSLRVRPNGAHCWASSQEPSTCEDRLQEDEELGGLKRELPRSPGHGARWLGGDRASWSVEQV
jgi:hypothetical protein